MMRQKEFRPGFKFGAAAGWINRGAIDQFIPSREISLRPWR
jgi:hypothetical protein